MMTQTHTHRIRLLRYGGVVVSRLADGAVIYSDIHDAPAEEYLEKLVNCVDDRIAVIAALELDTKVRRGEPI